MTVDFRRSYDHTLEKFNPLEPVILRLFTYYSAEITMTRMSRSVQSWQFQTLWTRSYSMLERVYQKIESEPVVVTC